MNHLLVDQLLVPFILRFFFIFGIIAFAVGVGLIVNHVGMHRLFGVMNKWVSMRHSTRWLAIPRDSGPVVQRFRRPIGMVFILVATISIFILVTRVDVSRVISVFGIETPHTFVTWVMECMRRVLVGGGMLAIAIGIMLIFFPHVLHAIETRANHWYSFRSYSQSGDALHTGFDNWIEHYPRTMGWIIALAALVVVVDFGILLFARS